MRANILLFVLCCMGLCACSSTKQKEATPIDDTLTVPDMMTLTFTETQIMEQVAPPTPTGYYHYFEPKEGYVYLCQKGTIKNTSKNSLHVNKMKLQLVNRRVDGEFTLMKEDGSSFDTTIATKETKEFYMVFLIDKDEIKVGDQDDIRMDFHHQFLKEGEPYEHSYTKKIEVATYV